MLAIGNGLGRSTGVLKDHYDVELKSETGEHLGIFLCDKYSPSNIYRVDLDDQFCYPVSLNDLELVKK